MKPNPVHRLPAPLEAAVQRLKLAAREAAERTIESLGLAALASSSAYHRDGLLGAQFELNRKSAIFALTFNDALDERVLRELGPQGGGTGGSTPETVQAATPKSSPESSWGSFSLVEDKEVEAQISAERFGMEISFACEWELRELDGYVSALLGDAGGERDRKPLKPDLVGHAMLRGIDAVSDRADIRKVLSAELIRSLTALLRQTYGDILGDLRNAGLQPVGLSVRNRPGRSGGGSAAASAAEAGEAPSTTSAPLGSLRNDDEGAGTGRGRGQGFAPSTRGHTQPGRVSSQRGTSLGQVDPALMSLIRRLAYSDSAGGAAQASGYGEQADAASTRQPPNVIRANREELREASKGALDHMVIDVIGFMFDQILADPKVPPQMARQIARLQLPVLRAALGDPSFFSSRKHPVRRFVNRIASLGSAFEDFDEEGAKAFLAKVKELIHEVVEGDFDQIEVYEQKVAALEAFTAELGMRDGGDRAAAALLSEKEDQQRLRHLYAQRLEGELRDVPAPPFLRDFISQVWSQVLMRATEEGGADGAAAQRLRTVGRDLFLSVLPKATPALRKAFLSQLPKLMQDLTEGMNLIAWPEEARRKFFGQLMPAHAEALKSSPTSQLEINLRARDVEVALRKPMPSRAELGPPSPPPSGSAPLAPPTFSEDEARRVGLVQESAVDWSGQVDIDLSAQAAATADEGGAVLPGLPSPTEAPDATEGAALANHLEVGFAYQMHIESQWRKVRLSHVSPGRSFYLFSYGGRHRKTVSLTQRMLSRMCETGRLRAYESAYLIERATERARRQLSALAAGNAG